MLRHLARLRRVAASYLAPPSQINSRTAATIIRSIRRHGLGTSKRARSRKAFLELLEDRQLLTSAPVSLDDPEYLTGVDTDLIVSSAAAGVLANDFDAEEDPLTASIVDDPEHGTLLSFNSDGTFTYRPDTGFAGTDTFTYVANDGTEDGELALVTITIVPTNEDPDVFVGDAWMAEGDPLIFMISLSRVSLFPVTIEYGTANGTATAGQDYASVSPLEVTFEPGETWKEVVVNSFQDFVENEDDETVLLNLTSAEGATITDSQGVGTLFDGLPPTEVRRS